MSPWIQTKKKDCDNFVITLFIMYQKSYKRKFCLIYFVISITLHQKYGGTVENTNANHCITKTKDGWMKLKDIVQQENNMAKEFCD